MSDVSIRLAKPEELRQIQDLNHELFVSDQKHNGDLNVQWPYEAEGESYFRRMIAEEIGICLVAVLNDEIVGYLAGCTKLPQAEITSKRAEVENMFVKAKMRSQGIGSQLIQTFYDWCKSKDVDYVMVNAFTPNTRALSFYRKQGFTDYSTTLWYSIKKK